MWGHRPDMKVRPLLRLAVLAVCGGLAGAALVACNNESAAVSGGVPSSDGSSVPNDGSTPDGPRQPGSRTIVVTAVGQAHGQPDSLTLSIGAEVTGPTVGEALSGLSGKLTNLLGYLGDQGISGQDIQTTWLSTYPLYNGSEGSVPTITGYQATVAVNVRVDDLDTAGTLVDGAGFVLGDALRLQGISWTIVDSDPLLATARTDAVERAQRQAEQIAEAAGLELGALRSVREDGNGISPVSDAAAGGGGFPVSPGSQPVTVVLRVEFDASAP